MSLFSNVFNGIMGGTGKFIGSAAKLTGNAPLKLWETVKDMKTADGIKSAMSSIKTSVKNMRSDAPENIDYFKSGFVGTNVGYGFNILGRFAGGTAGGIMKLSTMGPLPYAGVAAAGGIGITAGLVKNSVMRTNERMMNGNNKGMNPNNLGTDGLTLSLSKIRHR